MYFIGCRVKYISILIDKLQQVVECKYETYDGSTVAIATIACTIRGEMKSTLQLSDRRHRAFATSTSNELRHWHAVCLVSFSVNQGFQLSSLSNSSSLYNFTCRNRRLCFDLLMCWNSLHLVARGLTLAYWWFEPAFTDYYENSTHRFHFKEMFSSALKLGLSKVII